MGLRDYQQEAVARVREAWREGRHHLLGTAGTGLGKTVIGIAAVTEDMKNGDRALWLAHRNELLTQPEAAFARWAPTRSTGIVKGTRREYFRDIVIASVQSLRGKRLEELPRCTHLVIDEAHHALEENTYGGIVQRLLDLNGALRILGLTATPFRTDRKGLGGLFDEAAFNYDIQWGIQHGWLAPIRGLRVETGTSLDEVRVRAGDFVQADLAKATNTAARNQVIVEAYQEHAAGRRALAFTSDVEHAHDLAEAFRDAGIAAEAIWGAMDKQRRAEVLADLHAGRISVATNFGVLTEGFDCPELACMLMARPTRSLNLYVQMLGRGTRTAAGKDDCLIIDLCDLSKSVGRIVTLVDLRIPGTYDEEEQEEQEPRLDTLEKPAEPPLDEYGRLDWHAVEVDLFTGDVLWQFVGGSRLLDVGGGRIVVVWPVDGQGYRAAVADIKGKRIEHITWGVRPEAEVLRAAETVARRCAPDGRFVALSKWWDRPDNLATDKQRKTLQRFGFPDSATAQWTRGKSRRVLNWCFARACYASHLAGGHWPSGSQLHGYAEALKLRGG